MQRYDVVIVGAGPAGLNCARILSQSNLKILLLEKNDVIGPKICGGVLYKAAVEYLNLPEELLEFAADEIIIHTPRQRLPIRQEKNFIYTVNREVLGQWQLEQLEETGIEIRTQSRVTEVTSEYIEINKTEKVDYDYLVGADGVYSVVRKYLNLPKSSAHTFQYLIPDRINRNFEFYYDPEYFKSWFVWNIPHKDYVSIGCGADPRIIPVEQIKKNFHQWLNAKKIDYSRGKLRAWPINFDFRGMAFGNVFLVGEAAGLASYLTGEGIYPALISGEFAAKSILSGKLYSGEMVNIVKKHKSHESIVDFTLKSGSIFPFELELFGLIIKCGWFNKKLLDYFL